ncbi:MAG: hypothetical protein J2P58_04280 [Acidimicrobiaceae bacterium]|nr:hypothetical protein [Acidimicrobiaceae bacterium]
MTSHDGGQNLVRGLDLANLDVTTSEEVNAHLINCFDARGPLYDLYASSLMLDYGGPAFIKHHTAASFETEGQLKLSPVARTILRATHTLSAYVKIGWEMGIRNEFNVLRQVGVPKEQSMEVVLFSQLYAGMRGLGHTYHAVGDFLPAYREPMVPAEFPPGWDTDPGAFKSGLDFSIRGMTKTDVENLTAWYETNVGYLPDSMQFGLKYHPEFVKANRGKWEAAIRTLPKQFAPHLMIRQNMLMGNVDGLRESVMLGKAWGMTRELVIFGISGAVMYFTGFEGYYTAMRGIDDILESWDGRLE